MNLPQPRQQSGARQLSKARRPCHKPPLVGGPRHPQRSRCGLLGVTHGRLPVSELLSGHWSKRRDKGAYICLKLYPACRTTGGLVVGRRIAGVGHLVLRVGPSNAIGRVNDSAFTALGHSQASGLTVEVYAVGSVNGQHGDSLCRNDGVQSGIQSGPALECPSLASAVPAGTGCLELVFDFKGVADQARASVAAAVQAFASGAADAGCCGVDGLFAVDVGNKHVVLLLERHLPGGLGCNLFRLHDLIIAQFELVARDIFTVRRKVHLSHNTEVSGPNGSA